MSYSTITTETKGATLLITVNRPEVMNALNATVLEEIDAAIDELHSKKSLKGAIITGSGEKAFVAGADIAVINKIDDEDQAMETGRRGQAIFDKIEGGKKPVIAAVNGFALGGGCELAMACHMRVASSNARFGQPEVNLGLIPGYGGTQRMTRLIGRTKATELILTGDLVKAEQALELGLLNAVVEPEALIAKCEEILSKIYAKSSLAVGLSLEAIHHGCLYPAEGMKEEARLFAKAVTSKDGKEGTAAFLEKRPANFTGE